MSKERETRDILTSKLSAESLEPLSFWTGRTHPGTTSLSWQQRRVGTVQESDKISCIQSNVANISNIPNTSDTFKARV